MTPVKHGRENQQVVEHGVMNQQVVEHGLMSQQINPWAETDDGYEPNAQALKRDKGECPCCREPAPEGVQCIECQRRTHVECAVTGRTQDGRVLALCSPCYWQWAARVEAQTQDAQWVGLQLQREFTERLANQASALAQRTGEAVGASAATILAGAVRFGTGMVAGVKP